MIPSNVLTKLHAGEPALSLRVSFQDPDLVEMVSLMGIDAVWLCQEHRAMDGSMMDSLIRACRAGGSDAIMRTKPGRHPDVLQPIEAGARGLMIPWVRDAMEVRQVIEWMKFPPLGRKGFDGVNPDADFGLMPGKDYVANHNKNTFTVIQIEDPNAVDQIEEIAAMDGVDILFLGPSDLSINLGYPLEFNHPEVKKVAKRIVKACQASGKFAGMTCPNEDYLKEYLDLGYRFFNYRSAIRFVRDGMEDFLKVGERNGFKFRRTHAFSP